MPAQFTIPLVTVIPGQLIASSLWNNEFGNLFTNLIPAGIDSYSDTDGQMQIQTAPYPGSVTSHASNMGGEIERIRYQLAQILGTTYWYQPAANGNNLSSVFITGEVRSLAHSTIPPGWLALTGTIAAPQNVSRITYSGLFGLLGTTWGIGDGSTTFGLPPVDCAMVGAGNLYSVGQIFGEATHLLTPTELPNQSYTVTDPTHNHGVNDPGHQHVQTGATNPGSTQFALQRVSYSTTPPAFTNVANSTATAVTGISINNASTGISVSDTNGNGSHNNIQPSIGVTFIIKT